MVLPGCHRNRHGATRRRVADRVVEQVAQHPHCVGLRGEHGWQGPQLCCGRQPEAHAGYLCHSLRAPRARGDEVGQRHRPCIHTCDPGGDAAQLEQVVHQLSQACRLLPDGVEVALHVGRIGDHAVLHRLGHGPDSCQWATQVVGDPGHELAARPFEGELAIVGLLEAVGHGHQVPCQAVQLCDPRLGSRRTVAARELLAELRERGDIPVEAAAEPPGNCQAGSRRGRHDHRQGRQVVGGDEHGAGTHHHTHRGGAHRDESHRGGVGRHRGGIPSPREQDHESDRCTRSGQREGDEAHRVAQRRSTHERERCGQDDAPGQDEGRGEAANRGPHGSKRYPPATVTRWLGRLGSDSTLVRSLRTCTVTVAVSP